MHPAVATLQQAARRLQHSGNMDPSKYTWMMSQLRGVTAELDASERRARESEDRSESTSPSCCAKCWQRPASPCSYPTTIMVAGPDQSLRDLLGCLIEVALGARPNSLDLRAAAGRRKDKARETFTIELAIQSPTFPIFSGENCGKRRGREAERFRSFPN